MSQLPPKFENLGEKLCLVTAVMPVSGGLGGLYPTRNLGVQFSYSNQEGGGEGVRLCPPRLPHWV